MASIAIIDAHHFIIPNYLSAAAFGWRSPNAGLQAPEAIAESLLFATLRGAILAVVFLGVREFYWRLRGREGPRARRRQACGRCRRLARLADDPDCRADCRVCGTLDLSAAKLLQWAADPRHRKASLGLFLAPAIWLAGCWKRSCWPASERPGTLRRVTARASDATQSQAVRPYKLSKCHFGRNGIAHSDLVLAVVAAGTRRRKIEPLVGLDEVLLIRRGLCRS